MKKKTVWILLVLALMIIGVIFLSISQSSKDTTTVAVTPKDLKSIEELAQKGDSKAQNELGNIYANGTLVEQSFSKAKEWYEKAAVNSVEAQYNLGTMYQNAIGVEQDYKKALEYYKKAAALGHTEAKENIEIICEENPSLCK